MADNVDTTAAPAAATSEPAVVTPVSVPPSTVGEALRAARAAHELTVEQVAAELRIEPKQLVALEENRFEQIGVPVFVKGYIRQYGQRFGMNTEELLAIYHRQGKLAEVELQPNRAITMREDRPTSPWIVAGVLGAAIVIAIAVWWWNDAATFEVTREAASAAPAPAAAAPVVAPTAVAPSVASPPAAQPVAPAPAEGGATAEPTPAAAAPVAEAEPTVVAAAAPVQPIPLDFRFSQESWAEVSDGRGERLLFGLSAAGRQVTVRGEPPFSVLLGNANAVELRVNGKVYPIPTEGRQGSLARFSVDIAEE
jgi:cytoskeleton protein RodZ